MAQHDFQYIAPPVKSLLEAIFQGPNNTVCVEKVFQSLEDCGRSTKNKRLSRVKRMHHPIATKLLDQFELPAVAAFESDVPADLPRQPPRSMFHAMGAGPTIENKALEGIMGRSAPDAPPSHNAQGLQAEVSAWQLLVHCYVESRLHMVGDAWRSLLVLEDGVVRNMTGDHFLALKVSQFGCLVWPLDMVTQGCHTCFLPRLLDGTHASWLHVLVLSEFQAVPTQALPPRVAREVFKGSSVLCGVAAFQSGDMQSLERCSTLSGFPSLTDKFLDRLGADFAVWQNLAPKERPRGVLAKVEALVRHSVPEIEGGDLERILRRRSGAWAHPRESLLVNNLEHTEGALDPDDAKEARAFKEKAKTQSSSQLRTLQWLRDRGIMSEARYSREARAFSGTIGSADGPKKHSPAPPAPSLKEQWSWKEQWLKRHVPQHAGATIQEVIDANRQCWVARYLGASEGAKSCTRSYKSGLRSSADPAQLVFKWLWDTHEACTGEPCPFAIEDLAVA